MVKKDPKFSRSVSEETLPADMMQSSGEFSNKFNGVSASPSSDSSQNDGQTKLKRELGLMEGCAVILGCIIGSGIFISPKGVLMNAGSPGLSLVVWNACGTLSLFGALCYAELGTSIPRSGGDYTYIKEAFGGLPSFLFLWASNLIFIPTTNAVMSLTFAKYVVQPFFPDCASPDSAVRLIAALAICFLTFMNCWNINATAKVQNIFMFTKLGALCAIIIFGFKVYFEGDSQDLSNLFADSSSDPGRVAASFYTGMFSYAGWNYLNFMTEELQDPYKNLPRAIYISLPLVSIVYSLANIAYLMVLTPAEILSSDAIAVTFSNIVMGPVSKWIIPMLVAISAFGALSVHIMTSSRLSFVGAREGHFPGALATVNVNYHSPMIALLAMCSLSLIYLCTTDILLLIEYASFVESLFILVTICGFVYLRLKRPEIHRPIRIPLVIAIIFMVVCGFLVFLPIYVKPFEVGMGLAITLTGVPAYLVFIVWNKKIGLIRIALEKIVTPLQFLTLSVNDDKAE